MSTDALATGSAEWPIVQTEAGAVTLATAEALQSRLAQWRDWIAKARMSRDAMARQAEDHLVAAGTALVANSTSWSIPAELQPVVQQAKAFGDRAAADDQIASTLRSQEHASGLFRRLGLHRQEHDLEQDRGRAATELRPLLLQIARVAPPTNIASAESERKAAADLEAQVGSIDGQLASAQAQIAAGERELKLRDDAIKAMGFDSLYTAAVLQTSGSQQVDSPLVLKAGERAYLSVPATLARLMTRTRYVGGSRGFSFPIGHTGIRYRVGSFTGHRVQQQSLTKLDTGTFVVTNQRVAYVGHTKSTSVPLGKLLHVEIYNDGISIAREGKENPDFYLMSAPKYAVFMLNWVLANQARLK